MKPVVDSAGGHHLLKHTAPSIERVVECFDGAPVKEISKLIMRMGQRELQAKFNAVYGTVTRSNNNDWLRRKLFESIGVKSSNKSKSAAKRDNKVGPAKGNRVLKVTKPCTSRSSWSSPEDSTAPYGLAPPESPATVTHGDGSQTHNAFGPQQVTPMLAGQQMSAASADSGYMSGGASTMHARTYPMPRLAPGHAQPAAPGPHQAPPVGCAPVRIIYAPSHMPVHGSMHGGMHAPMVRMPSGSLAPPPQHSFPATYFLQPMSNPHGPRTPPLYPSPPHASMPMSAMVPAEAQTSLTSPLYPPAGDAVPPLHPALAPPGPACPGSDWLPDAAISVPPQPSAPQKECTKAEDALAHSSDEEFTLTFLPPADSGAMAPRGGKAAAGDSSATPARPSAALTAAAECNPWEPTARDSTDVLVRNSVFDSAPLEALGCSMACGDSDMTDLCGEDGAGSGGDLAASSCDESGNWFTHGTADEAVDCGSEQIQACDDDSSCVLLDSAIGSLVEATHSEGFGCAVLPPTSAPASSGAAFSVLSVRGGPPGAMYLK